MGRLWVTAVVALAVLAACGTDSAGVDAPSQTIDASLVDAVVVVDALIAGDAAPYGSQGAPRPPCTQPAPTEDLISIAMVEAGWSTPQRLPAPVNTNCPEDCPEISPDGTSLLFCWSDKVYGPDTLPEEWVEFLENPAHGTYSTILAGGSWQAPGFEDLGRGVAWSIDMAATRTADGSAVFFHSIRPDNIAKIEVFRAARDGAGWTVAERLGPTINDGLDTGEQGVSPDGSVVVFASGRGGGQGGEDFWVSAWTGSAWGAAVNLGSVINTADNETQAFIRADGMELYFTRDGSNPGIYRAPRVDTGTWGPGAWGTPVWVASGAVGEASVTADGNTLYFVHVYIGAGSTLLDADVFVSRRN